jgi:hypothetical protein
MPPEQALELSHGNWRECADPMAETQLSRSCRVRRQPRDDYAIVRHHIDEAGRSGVRKLMIDGADSGVEDGGHDPGACPLG